MTETQKQIKEYQQMLPGLKERVAAVAMLLVVSMTMVVSASFAWITLSRAPEVSMMATTVASNGNLEIALVNPEGEKPHEVAIGDSSATNGQSLVGANITWGNLVNLSDESYGLNQIDLRPALLSGYNLNKAPLYGATYSTDGRVQDMSATYQYASWTQAEDGTKYFAAGDAATYGVRAISSVKYENITGNAVLTAMETKTKAAYATTNSLYLDLIQGRTMADETRNISCMDGLTMLLEIFVNEKAESALKSGGDVYLDYQSVCTYTYRLLLAYQDILDAEGEALLLMANMQVYANDAEKGTEYFKTITELTGKTAAQLKALGVSLESLTTYKSDCTNLASAIVGMEPFAIAYDPDTGTATEPVYWADKIVNDAGETVAVDGIGKHIGKLVNVTTTTANGIPMNQITVSNAMTVISDPLKVVIRDGILKNTEQRLGAMLKDNEIKVTIYISAMSLGNKTAWVTTSAAMPFLSNNDMGTSFSMEATGQGDAVSLDTYGLAIDLWVRTNAQDSILILEGSTEYEEIDKTTIDHMGNVTVMYTVSNSEKGTSFDAYRFTESDGTVNIYDAVTHTVVDSEVNMLQEGYSLNKQKTRVVVGYDGEYRVWQDLDQLLQDELIAENSTTQGSGSCYVFYANPSDQTRILDMLSAFTIAFLDQEGTHIATAKLDTENAYAINGKVTVPMKVITGETYIDADGEEQVGIRTLPRNTATWLTAIIFLDGMQLTNEDVLAAGEIEGRLNIQFGSSNLMNPMDDLPLQQKYRIITASVTGPGMVNGTAQTMTSVGAVDDNGITDAITNVYDGTAKQYTVTLNVEGDQPNNVSAFFVRSIGANQGTRTEEKTFKMQDDGSWTATFDLLKPGAYSLRSVIVDGVEYSLEKTPYVDISGMAVKWIYCEPDSGMVMTADPYVDVDVQVEIDADAELMPKQVRALYRSREGQEYTAILAYNAEDDIWSGTARITASGEYTLLYLVMDGEYTELSATQQKTLVVTLGMKASVACTGILAMASNEDQTGTAENSYTFVFDDHHYELSMRAEIFDDEGNEIKALTDVALYYSLEGASLDQSGMYVTMQWSEADDAYKGVMEMISAGTYRFNRLEVSLSDNLSNIRTAPGAPVFSATPPDPPEVDLKNNETADYQFVPGSYATMSVNLRYAQTSTMWALFENVITGQQTLVPQMTDAGGNKVQNKLVDPEDPDGNNYYQFVFRVPDNDRITNTTFNNAINQSNHQYTFNADGSQDGEWVIREVWLQNVFDADSNYIGVTEGGPTAETSMVFDVYNEDKSPEDNIYSYVVQGARVSLTGTYTDDAGNQAGTVTEKTESVLLGKNLTAVTGDFMDSYSGSAQTLTISDWRSQAITGMTASWNLNFDGASVNNGGYSGATPFNNGETMTAAADGITYTVPAQTYQEAGNYVWTITYGTGSSYTNTIKCTYSVYSKTPTLAIDKISPSGTHNTVNSSNSNTQVTSKIDGNTIEIYPNSKVTGSGCNKKGELVEEPKVWLKLTNMGNADQATLTFTESNGGEVRLYYGDNSKNGTQTTGWLWEEDGSVQRFVGYNDAGSCDESKAAGTLTSANVLVLTCGGKTYTVSVNVITIINNRP